MGRINVISSIFEDSDVQHSMRDNKPMIACLDKHPRTSATSAATRRHDSCAFRKQSYLLKLAVDMMLGWAEAHIKITRMTLTIKLDRNWSSFQLANSTPPLSVTGSAIAPSARMLQNRVI